jgi:hypothetical protein
VRVENKNIAVLFHLYFVTKNGVNCRSAVSKNWKCEMHKLAILAKLFKFFFWRTTSRQTHQIRLVYATDNFFKRLGPYITHFPVVLPFHPIQGKRRERPIKCLSHRKPCKIQKNGTKLISVRKKSYTFSKYLMPSILEYIMHISYIFSFLL